MKARLLDGKAVAKEVKDEIRAEVAELARSGLIPGLATVLVGDHPASAIYVRNKRAACADVGIHSEGLHLPAATSEAELLKVIDELNRSPKIHGILVQLPLPPQIRSRVIVEAVSPAKDVDGLHPYNIGRLAMGDPVFVPCTPAGVMRLLDWAKIPLEGKTAVVVGRSNLVGKPVAALLLQRHATVTICHSRTKDLTEVCRRADVLVAAMGRAGAITGEMVGEGAAVIDVGINRREDGRLVGDVAFEEAAERAGWITPVPGGVGPMTIAMLLVNTVRAAKRRFVSS